MAAIRSNQWSRLVSHAGTGDDGLSNDRQLKTRHRLCGVEFLGQRLQIIWAKQPI